MNAVQRILVPTDFSDCAGAAAGWAALIAGQAGAAVEVVTVVGTTHFSDIYGDVAFRNERIEFVRGEARKRLEAYAQRYLPGLEHVCCEVRDGNTFLEILQAARETGCDLIVMGTHGRTGLAHVLIGSIAEKVVRKSPIPVVTVRPGQS